MSPTNNTSDREASDSSQHSANGFWIGAPLLLAGCVALAGWWVVRSAENTLKSNLAAKLETVVRVESEAVAAWVESRKQAFGVLSRRIQIHEQNGSKLLSLIERGELDTLAKNLGVKEFAYAADSGETIFSDEQGILASWPDPSSVIKATANDPLVFYISDSDESEKGVGPNSGLSEPRIESRFESSSSPIFMVVAGRIRQTPAKAKPNSANPDETESQSGVLMAALPVRDELTQIVSSSLMGNSGETLVFDQNGNLLSLSRFLIDSFDNELVDRLLSSGAYKQVDYSGFLDSRKQKVVGASQWNPTLGIGLVTKIDYDEAAAPILQVKRFIIVLCVVLFLAALSLLLYQYRRYRQNNLRRLKELQKRKLGMYHLHEKIGEGGMGIVYRGQHQLLARPTAVKILSPKRGTSRSVKRFEREVQLTSQLTHPNTISIYDYGRTDHGLFYYAMEFVEGLTLDQLVARDGCQSDGRTVHILIQICDSLIEAHHHGLIHRDIKPSNVMLCELGCVPDHVKVLDFGMVRDLADSASNRMGLSGTPLYMPPEALSRHASIDHRFDIFSVGAVGYYLLTGKHLRKLENLNQLLANCRHWTVERIAAKLRQHAEDSGTEISEQLISILARSAAPDPRDRVETIVELKSKLLECLLHNPWDEDAANSWWKTSADNHEVSKPVQKRFNTWSLPTDSLERKLASSAESLRACLSSDDSIDIYESTVSLEGKSDDPSHDPSNGEHESHFVHLK